MGHVCRYAVLQPKASIGQMKTVQTASTACFSFSQTISAFAWNSGLGMAIIDATGSTAATSTLPGSSS
jgi:hypothetical protein